MKLSSLCKFYLILEDPWADSGDEGKSKQPKRCGTKKSKERTPFFTFLRGTFFRPFRLSLAPFICHWVSEDGFSYLPSTTKETRGNHKLYDCSVAEELMSSSFFVKIFFFFKENSTGNIWYIGLKFAEKTEIVMTLSIFRGVINISFII